MGIQTLVRTLGLATLLAGCAVAPGLPHEDQFANLAQPIRAYRALPKRTSMVPIAAPGLPHHWLVTAKREPTKNSTGISGRPELDEVKEVR